MAKFMTMKEASVKWGYHRALPFSLITEVFAEHHIGNSRCRCGTADRSLSE